MKSIALILFTIVLPSGVALAHHGQDFFVTLDARVPAKNGMFTFATMAVGNDNPALEAGFIAGIGSNLALGFAVDGNQIDDLQANAITPILQWSIPLQDSPLRLGGSFSYHFFDSSRLDATNGGHSHGAPHSHRRALSPRFNPDAPPPPPPPLVSRSDAATIHLHEEDFYLSRFIIEYELSAHTRMVSNLILAGTPEADAALGYACALRHSVSHNWAVGAEAIGDFRASGYHQVILGIIHTPRHDLSLRLGLSTGLGATADDTTGLLGLTWRF